jgi:hypothetical protein
MSYSKSRANCQKSWWRPWTQVPIITHLGVCVSDYFFAPLLVYIIIFHFLHEIRNLTNFIFVKTTSKQKVSKKEVLRIVIGQKYTFPSFKPLVQQNLAYSARSLNLFKQTAVNKSYDFEICQIHMAYFSRCYLHNLSHSDDFHFDSHPILGQILPHCG